MTEIDTKALEVLLRRIPSERVLQWIRSSAWAPRWEEEEAFLQFAAGNLPEYSQDEHRLIFSRLREEAAGLIGGGAERKDLDLPTMTIGLLLSAARRLLTQAGEEPQCKVERVRLVHVLFRPVLHVRRHWPPVREPGAVRPALPPALRLRPV